MGEIMMVFRETEWRHRLKEDRCKKKKSSHDKTQANKMCQIQEMTCLNAYFRGNNEVKMGFHYRAMFPYPVLSVTAKGHKINVVVVLYKN